MNRAPMHVLVNCKAHGLTPVDSRGNRYESDVVTFGGRVVTKARVVMIYAGTDAQGDPYLIHERFRRRLPAIRRRLTDARRRA